MKILKKYWKLFFSGLLVVSLFWNNRINFDQFLLMLFDFRIIAAGTIIFGVQTYLFALRWRYFIKPPFTVPANLILKLHLIGMFFNFFIPGGVGGDVFKAFELSKLTEITKANSFSSAFSDRLFSLLNLIVFSVLFLSVNQLVNDSAFLRPYLLVCLILAVAAIGGLIVTPKIYRVISRNGDFSNRKFIGKLDKFALSLMACLDDFKNFRLQAKILILNFCLLMTSILFIYFVFSLGGKTPESLILFVAITTFGLLVSSIPFFPAGIGVGQYAFYDLFLNVNSDLAKLSIIAISLVQIFNLVYAILGGICFGIRPDKKLNASQNLAN